MAFARVVFLALSVQPQVIISPVAELIAPLLTAQTAVQLLELMARQEQFSVIRLLMRTVTEMTT